MIEYCQLCSGKSQFKGNNSNIISTIDKNNNTPQKTYIEKLSILILCDLFDMLSTPLTDIKLIYQQNHIKYECFIDKNNLCDIIN